MYSTGRGGVIRDARRALTTNDGGLRGVALIGLDGVGKSSVASAIIRSGSWRTVRRLRVSQPVDCAELKELLKEIGNAPLVVFSGLHWLVSAGPGGFEPLRRFVDHVIADSGQRAWLVQAESLLWSYAAKAAPLSEAFPEQVRLEPLSSDGLKAAVMERHRLSGYGHAFIRMGGSSRLESLIAGAASRLRRPLDQYFADLHEATGGLIRDALRLWLASVQRVENDDLVHVGHVPASGYIALRRLPEELLLLLYLISRQGWMSAEVLAYLLQVSPPQAPRPTDPTATLGPSRITPWGRLPHRVASSRRGRSSRSATELDVTLTLVDPATDIGWIAEAIDAFGDYLDDGRTARRLTLLLGGALVATLGAIGVRRFRGRLSNRGILPSALAGLHLALRLLVLVFSAGFVVHVLPARVGVVTLLVFAGLAVALGWSIRDLLPDLVGGLVLTFERRVRRGVWIRAVLDEQRTVTGSVEALGLRTTTLLDESGRTVSVPNRLLLDAPLTLGGPTQEHEVCIRLPHRSTEGGVRKALYDAALSSPWVFPGSQPTLLRDPADPACWRIRVRLLEPRFGTRFDGEMVERAEANLNRVEPIAAVPQAAPNEAP